MLRFNSIPTSTITDGRINDAAFRLACYIGSCATDGKWAEDIPKARDNLNLSSRTYFRLKSTLLEIGLIVSTKSKNHYLVSFAGLNETRVSSPNGPKPEIEKPVEELPELPALPEPPKTAKNGNHAPQATEIPLKMLEGFDEWYTTYPRRIGRRAAEKAYISAIKRGATPKALLMAAEAYAAFTSERNTEPQFIPHPSTWLNADRWEDDDLKPFVGRSPASEGELAPLTI